MGATEWIGGQPAGDSTLTGWSWGTPAIDPADGDGLSGDRAVEGAASRPSWALASGDAVPALCALHPTISGTLGGDPYLSVWVDKSNNVSLY